MSKEIKSAKEIALARAEAAVGQITQEDRLRWQFVPEGEKLAARVIKGDVSITEELEKADQQGLAYIKQGAFKTLMSNIVLPSGEIEKNNTLKAIDAITELVEDRHAVEAVVKNIKNLLDHYETHGQKQKQQALEQLKHEYSRKVQQALEQQLGSSASGMNADVENLPQFKEEKRNLEAQFDGQYQSLLDEYKQELKDIG